MLSTGTRRVPFGAEGGKGFCRWNKVRRTLTRWRPDESADLPEWRRLHAPFVALIDCAADVPDEWFLERLGLRRPSRSARRGPWSGRHVLFGEVGSWKLLADPTYELWYNHEIRPLLVELAVDRTVFSYDFGDTDDAHAIRLLRGGEIHREWVVDDRFGGGAATAVVDTGDPLEGERGVFDLSTECAPYFHRLAAAHAVAVEDGLLAARAWRVSADHEVDSARERRLRAGSWADVLD